MSRRRLSPAEQAAWQRLAATVAPMHRPQQRSSAAPAFARSEKPSPATRKPGQSDRRRANYTMEGGHDPAQALRRDARASPAQLRAEFSALLDNPARFQTAKPSATNHGGRPAPAPAVIATHAPSLDGHWDRKLRKGAIHPDAIIDLHGHNLDQAWHSIDRALTHARSSGQRILLLITGKARRAPSQRGLIRASVADWLAASPHADDIAALRNAHPRHGGAGALYIILRRK